MPNVLHRCPECRMVGKVQRSRTLGLTERIQRVMMPWYGMYRCHHCNWRGRLPRAGFTQTTATVMSAAVVIVALALLAGLLYLLAMMAQPKFVD